MTSHATATRLADALDARLTPRHGVTAPAQAWGVFDGSSLVEVRGHGDAAALPAHTAFRIASCTKSFTAAAALLLAEDGVLDLDEPLADALDVPLTLVVEPGSAASADSPAPTIRDALAMRAGFPTDDPWADRQESLGDDAFGRVLSDGVRVMWPAGAAFEYSNLGYAIVGRILALRAGMPYRRLVESRLLEPLGLTGTAFDTSVGAAGGAITGYRRGPDGWEAREFSAPGAFSPIGGLFSTVADLSRWCSVLAGASGDGVRVLPSGLAERLQEPHTAVLGDLAASGPWQAYALGLVIRADGERRRFVAHNGGYPGFSTHMTWETGSRVGVVAFENANYTKLALPARAALDEVFPSTDAVPAEPPAPTTTPWSVTLEAAGRVRDAVAEGRMPDTELLDACVDLDQPLPRREAVLRAHLEAIGGVESVSEFTHENPAHAAWSLRGPHGEVRLGVALTPHRDARVQRVDVELVGAPA